MIGVISLMLGSVNAESLEKEDEPLVHVGINVDLKDPMSSDMSAFGARIFLDNKVEGDFNAMGEDIVILSPVQGNLDIVARKVLVSSKIKGDAQIFASRVLFKERARVEGKTYILAQKVVLKGRMKGEVLIRAQKVYLDGKIEGNLIIDAPKIILGKNVILNGALIYPQGAFLKISKEAKIIGGQKFLEKSKMEEYGEDFENDVFEGIIDSQVHNIMHTFLHKGVEGHWSFNMNWGPFLIIILLWIVAFSVLSLFYRASPHILRNLTNEALENPGRSLGIGLIGLIMIPVLAILMCLTIVGIPVALIVGFAYFLFLFLGKILGVWIFAQWFLSFTPFREKPSCGRDLVSFLIALPVVSCLSLIPLFGWLFAMLIFLTGFGVLLSRMVLPKKRRVIYINETITFSE